MIILMGEKTLPGIELTTSRFLEEYQKYNPNPNYYLQKGKKHKPMIVQFIYTPNKAYKWILDFMESTEWFKVFKVNKFRLYLLNF